ncbi:class I SAM-dependent methyltransferase [Vallitalea pronyensis]|uniref:Class I SAM-dependent methyltransferase n=1 Tax=Vallitalea pronyensis TaxID=1348613 RepID=A0A8J8SHP3_9FIRM|nr:class I SAM-dependent methyltransferase [Vallitalea pronyensis]QUI23786.1 class I SAM-dependent methyltransferase [Vallitalea pronyensis]
MKPVFRQTQLYTFLLYTNGKGLEKKILDLGAGGNLPPLAIFNDQGYETYGIDISDEQIQRAKEFEKKQGISLNIMKGDMTQLPFDNDAMPYIYSYNSIFHMSKKEIGEAIKEIHRVLSVGGLAFLNFPTINDAHATHGEKVGEGEYLQEEYGEKVLHSYFDIEEPEKLYFEGFEVIYKENRIRNGFMRDGTRVTRGFVDYILEKK